MEIQRKIARLLVGGGSTMLIGHHPHVIIGVEQIDNVNIYYSLGNFIFPNVELQDKTIFRWDKISRSSIVLKASFKSEFWSIDRKYLYLDKSGLPKLDKDDRALKRFDQLSKIFEYKDYSRIYNYYSKLETIRNISKRTIRINKLFKDILWYLKQKSLK